MTLQITRVGRAQGPIEHQLSSITHYHWIEDGTELSGMFTGEEMFDFVKQGGCAYVFDCFWKKHLLVPAVTKTGIRYLKTDTPEEADDYLLNLPFCPDED